MTICITGAGGKTSLLYALAEQAHAEGRSVDVSTTTHIRQPERDYSFPVLGTPCEDGKLTALPEEELAALQKRTDLLLLEADGAKQMSLKVPAVHEPVIPADCCRVIGVMGMDALGGPLQEVCFRLSEAQKFLNCGPEHIVSLEDMDKIARSKNGLAKGAEGKEYAVVLNKCEGERTAEARKLRELLQASGIAHVVLTVHGRPVAGEEAAYAELLR